TLTRLKPAATAASTVPSPPSATGTLTISPSKPARTRPADSRAATSAAGRLPLNLSGASSTFLIGRAFELGKFTWGVTQARVLAETGLSHGMPAARARERPGRSRQGVR